MERKKKTGKCHLCGKVKKLSLEHVPPRAAFNEWQKKLYTGEQLIAKPGLPWDFSALSGEHHQNGIGWNTLCEKCNSNSGGWYVKAYVDFACKTYKQLEDSPPTISLPYVYKIYGVYPLRVAKAVLIMFLSTNSAGFLDKNKKLRDLLLEKTLTGIDPKKYGIGMYINASKLSKYIGVCAILKGNEVEAVSEISLLPFGFVLRLDPKNMDGFVDITGWLDYQYDDKVDLEITIPVYDSNTVLPLDFRSKDEVLKQAGLVGRK